MYWSLINCRCLKLVLLAGLILIACTASFGQSGRRTSKPPPPVVEPEPEATPTPKPKPAPTLLFNVGIDNQGGLAQLPLSFYSATLNALVERLNSATEVKAASAGNVTRGDATKSAKAGKEGYVVYVQLRLDSLRPSAYSTDARDVVLEYYVMAPQTAKVVASGTFYPRAYQNKGIPGRTSTSTVYSSYLLEQAARDAAEQILHHFKTRKPVITNY